MDLRSQIASVIKGDVQDDAETLKKFSRDTSIFERKPTLVVSPKDADDVSALVRFASEAKKRGENISLTAPPAAPPMSGGPLTDSVVVSFTKYMNAMGDIGADYAVAEPGIYYRDFEAETLAENGSILPPYPS